MLNLDLYIHSTAFLTQKPSLEGDTERMKAIEPDYSSLIPPMLLRRMSKAVRMGIGASKSCLSTAQLEQPDAIIIGTTLGCLQDTESFLQKMVVQEEKMLTPTAFIQSTHNTVAGQIALATGCLGYNSTISQHGHSFEGALVASALLLQEHPDKRVLCGGVDEWTETSFLLMKKAGLFTKKMESNASKLAGEGAGFLLLSKQRNGAAACIKGVLTFSESNTERALQRIDEILEQCAADLSQDVLCLGISKEIVQEYPDVFFKEYTPVRTLFYKDLTGEYGTAIATAICLTLSEARTTRRAFFINNYCADWSVVELEFLG